MKYNYFVEKYNESKVYCLLGVTDRFVIGVLERTQKNYNYDDGTPRSFHHSDVKFIRDDEYVAKRCME
jgi:hypothetical protein